MDFNDPKEFDDPQVLDDLKEISIGSMDFDNPKVYGDTFISDGLVFVLWNIIELQAVLIRLLFIVWAERRS